MQPASPATRPQIVQALTSVEDAVASFFAALAVDEFVLRVGDAWTPAEHLVHLNTSVNAVGRGLSTSAWLLRVRFGRARTPSRSYEDMREAYRTRLAGGGGATGPYVPPREELASEVIEARRAEILARWQRVNARLRASLAGWSERNLDRIRMPHPLLGRLTVREMLFFTLYHNQHHIAAAKGRLPRFGGAAPQATT